MREDGGPSSACVPPRARRTRTRTQSRGRVRRRHARARLRRPRRVREAQAAASARQSSRDVARSRDRAPKRRGGRAPWRAVAGFSRIRASNAGARARRRGGSAAATRASARIAAPIVAPRRERGFMTASAPTPRRARRRTHNAVGRRGHRASSPGGYTSLTRERRSNFSAASRLRRFGLDGAVQDRRRRERLERQEPSVAPDASRTRTAHGRRPRRARFSEYFRGVRSRGRACARARRPRTRATRVRAESSATAPSCWRCLP